MQSDPEEKVATSVGDGLQDALREIRGLASPLRTPDDLGPLVSAVSDRRLVCVGEASHGTHEFYRWRADLSQQLIEQAGFNWIGVEGDWPDCWRINRWVRGLEGAETDAAAMLSGFERWPTWMWANDDVASFLDWLREWNRGRPSTEQVGFYGLDVYSLWDSLRRIMDWLEENAPEAMAAASRAWRCFVPFGEDPHRYAWSTRLVPETCEADVVALLAQVRRTARGQVLDVEAAFDAAQNAAVAVEAERYYRVMVRGDRESWNIRDQHMVDTITRVEQHVGPGAKGLVWEHNTHIGDARATDMAGAGMVNVGQLVRDRYGADRVALIGFAAYQGRVLAATSWGAPEEVMDVPPARAWSHEDLLHRAMAAPALLVFGKERRGPWLSARAGHRAIGVVYQPEREMGNYVPTVMGARYDALLWLEETRELTALHHERQPREAEYETEPSGF